MSQRADLTAREAEVIRILKVLASKSNDFVVFGGYAINALTSHRFSVDCDIVIDSKAMKEIDSILKEEGYKTQARIKKDKTYGERMKKYVKQIGGRKVAVEVFPKQVSSRQTDGTWSIDVFMKNSTKSRVVGLTDSAQALVPTKELMMALKLHAGRDTDLRDVAMLSERVSWEAVKDFASTGDLNKVRKQIESAITTISKPEFASALKAEFAIRHDVTPLIKRTVEGLNKLRKSFVPDPLMEKGSLRELFKSKTSRQLVEEARSEEAEGKETAGGQ